MKRSGKETLEIHYYLVSSAKTGSTILHEATRVIQKEEHFPGDEDEVPGYYRALDELEKWIRQRKFKITEVTIKTLHALVMGGKQRKVKPTPYRDGQNVIRESKNGDIVYMPPEAKDVAPLMKDLVKWIDTNRKDDLPYPLRAAIAHYQFAMIHPYYDGNGRTARLLANLVLYLGGYDLKGFYSLEEYYAQNLPAHYEALAIGPSHNYYVGRADADITPWVKYFCIGMAESFDAVETRSKAAAKTGDKGQTPLLRQLDTRQRKALTLFHDKDRITAALVGELFNLQPRSARHLCQQWVEDSFLTIANSAKKTRKYRLSKKFLVLMS